MRCARLGLFRHIAWFVPFLLILWPAVQLQAQKFYQCEVDEVPDVKVWAAESEREADFLVYFVYDSAELVGQPVGVVMQVPAVEEAKFSLSFVDDKKEADFSLWIVDTPEEAGWRNKKFLHFLDKYLEKKDTIR